MKRMIGCAVIAFSLAFVGSATARSSSETITTKLSLPSFPAAPPFFETYSGTFTAATSGTVFDSGNVTLDALFGAVPAPSTGVLQTTRTLTSSSDNGTLQLRCTQIAKSFSDPSAVPDTGTCAVLSATGIYAGLRGSGKLTGVVDFTAVPPTLTDVLAL